MTAGKLLFKLQFRFSRQLFVRVSHSQYTVGVYRDLPQRCIIELDGALAYCRQQKEVVHDCTHVFGAECQCNKMINAADFLRRAQKAKVIDAVRCGQRDVL